MNLNFMILYVRDMDKSRAFYTEILGMEVVEALSSPTFVTLRPAGGAMIGLQDKTAAKFPPAKETQSGSVELSFEVDDVDAIRAWGDYHIVRNNYIHASRSGSRGSRSRCPGCC